MDAIGVVFIAIFALIALMGIGMLPLALVARKGFERRDVWPALGYIVLGAVGCLFFGGLFTR